MDNIFHDTLKDMDSLWTIWLEDAWRKEPPHLGGKSCVR